MVIKMLFTTDFLRDLASTSGGVIPQPLDMSETDQKQLTFMALSSGNAKAAHEYFDENNILAKLVDMTPEEAHKELVSCAYAALEDEMCMEIDEFNADNAEGQA